MRIICILFSIFLLTLLTTGCSSIVGKKITTEVNPNFKLNEYKRIDLGGESDTFVISSLYNFFKEKGLPTQYYNKNNVKNGNLYVYANMEEGFCLPGRFNNRMWKWEFFFPKKAEVTIQDAVTKKVLLTCVYTRGLFAMDSYYEECREMILESLTKAFDDLKKKENVTDVSVPQQDIKDNEK